MRLAFAYATAAGMRLLVDAAERARGWSEIDARWVVGLHHGLTEPAALKLAASLPNSTVRLVFGGSRLDASSLVVGNRMHAKTIAVQGAKHRRVSSLLVGSGNLSRAAMGDPPNNFELGLELHGPPVAVSRQFQDWWSGVWQFGVPATMTLLDSYEQLRAAYLDANPEERRRLDPPTAATVDSAGSFWIEMGAGSGGARNQVEFSSDLVGFFGTPSPSRRLLKISYDGRTWTDRPLSPKRTTFNVDIWRLSLPTGVVDYPGRVIKLTKLGDGYELQVAHLNSAAHRRWRATSRTSGRLGRTGSGTGREYGFW